LGERFVTAVLPKKVGKKVTGGEEDG